ncbi:odorant receptor Or1 [Tribolium castaneum]|uniref:Odorant receptor n=1 Tax=Tribolium castaneum TaxID=7070 RepID=D6WWX5_TRICA|nr:PREDICTED: odorant receptor Or1 [Tribolium castaneum]EFA09170.1 odorant receptor 16 [Tribolium castaneum]|eukprot:XP_015838111.1 PREDICTED: odorant receptor Or1 [Tribolium castaneum]
MDKYDWRSHIKINILVLRFLGLWPKNTYHGFYIFHLIFMMGTFLLGHLFFQAANIYFIRTNLEAVTGTIYVLLVESLVVFKVYHLVKNMAMFKQLLEILDTEMFQPKNKKQIVAIDETIHVWKTIYKSFLYTCFGTNAFWAIYPLLDKSEGGKRLPFLAWYPYNTTITPLYEITYVYQIVSVSFITTVHVNVDVLVAALNIFNGSQFEILCDNLKNLHNGPVKENLIECIKHHKEILKFAERCNNFLNWILLVQFFIFAVSIGITMFQLTLVIPFSTEFYSLLTYGMAIILQIYMYCWFGNEVEIKSNKIPYAAFECNWVDFSPEVKKNLIFFIMRAQKPVKLSALNLFYLTLDTFMMIIKTSWSYFALLHQVSSRK